MGDLRYKSQTIWLNQLDSTILFTRSQTSSASLKIQMNNRRGVHRAPDAPCIRRRSLPGWVSCQCLIILIGWELMTARPFW